MLKLDHLTVIAPTLVEGVDHVRTCLNLDVPFGQRHTYMGTHNHLLQLGDQTYLEIIAVDPDAVPPRRARWFGLDDQTRVRRDWDNGRRLRGWVARTDAMAWVLEGRVGTFGRKVALPFDEPVFDITIPEDGSLPLDGAAPSIIDRRGKARLMDAIADLGARLKGFTLEHPEPDRLSELLHFWSIDRSPTVIEGVELRARAQIETSEGFRELT